MNEVIENSLNKIDQIEVSGLLDDRYFFIPSYQRGYRWTKQQIYDLCNDLLEYIVKAQNANKDNGKYSFYSLQPLIVRKGSFLIDGVPHEAYEVIDGQQRLTTISILYRFLAKNLRYRDVKDVAKDYSGKMLYHIFYETRPKDYQALEKSGFNELSGADIVDVDIAHVSNAYYYIGQWLDGSKVSDPECAEATYSLFSTDPYARKTVLESLFNLLNSVNTPGSVQFVWYEIDCEKDAIREFLTENKGKIKLTDVEKIRALFMQRNNFENDIKNLKQLSIAKDWELIENTLHRNDFWSFISQDINLEDGRINVIFKYIFDNDSSTNTIRQEGDFLFRYFYQLLSKKNRVLTNAAVGSVVDVLWEQVMDCYRMLQNWYYNPQIYNLVGLLVKHGYSIKLIADIYNRDSVNTNADFIRDLNREIRKEIVDKIPIRKGNHDLDIPSNEEYIHLFFNNSKDKGLMPDLLRFINVREMNKTIDNALSDINKEPDERKKSDLRRSVRDVMSHIYRFPFEALDAFGWDIEHIDSATTNSLYNDADKDKWASGAEKTLGDKLLNDKQYSDFKVIYGSSTLQDKKREALGGMVNRIHEIVGEDDSEERKNWIGNLTLLDSGTNRSYKNTIFENKHICILDRIRSGVFVPICTQNVFNKNYEGCEPTDWKWSINDKKAYHSYILEEIKSYKVEFSE